MAKKKPVTKKKDARIQEKNFAEEKKRAG